MAAFNRNHLIFTKEMLLAERIMEVSLLNEGEWSFSGARPAPGCP